MRQELGKAYRRALSLPPVASVFEGFPRWMKRSKEILALIMALGNDADGFAKRSLFPSLMDGEL